MWHHRSFKSSHGVGVAISVDTEEILDAVALSKSCVTCEKQRNSKSEEEFDLWLSIRKVGTATKISMVRVLRWKLQLPKSFGKDQCKSTI